MTKTTKYSWPALIGLCILLPFFGRAQTDSVLVTFVKGSATNKQRQPIVPGSRLYSHDRVIFTAEDDFIIAINPRIGRVRIRPGNHGRSNGELLSLVLDMANISKDTRVLGSRGDADVPINLRLEQALTPDLRTNKKILITGVNKLLFDPTLYPVGPDKFFVLQLESADGSLVTKKLATIGDTLIIRLTDFEFGRGYAIAPTDKVYVCLFEPGQNLLTPVRQIDPYLDRQGTADHMVKMICNTYKEKLTADSTWDEISDELYLYLGKPNAIWLEAQRARLQNN